MKCTDALDVFLADREAVEADLFARAEAHVAECDDCLSVTAALRALSHEREVPVPAPRPGALSRAVDAAVEASARQPRSVPSFWRGVAVGGAIAASLAVAVVAFQSDPGTSVTKSTPQIVMARDESRAINISLDSVRALVGAEIHVVLTGDIELEGFAGQKELRWTTNLDEGQNQLSLPVVAIGSAGGQLLVEVQHDTKRRSFLVDIAGTG